MLQSCWTGAPNFHTEAPFSNVLSQLLSGLLPLRPALNSLGCLSFLEEDGLFPFPNVQDIMGKEVVMGDHIVAFVWSCYSSKLLLHFGIPAAHQKQMKKSLFNIFRFIIFKGSIIFFCNQHRISFSQGLLYINGFVS
uniref:Uncharacterized protein n=1 Tax=Micrurus corallinus TaxID=54390 RepID=A0A2D4G133_MICCO